MLHGFIISLLVVLVAIGVEYLIGVAPNGTLVFNFDSSGTLKTQIEEGADCDVFISAAPKQMNAPIYRSSETLQMGSSRSSPATWIG